MENHQSDYFISLMKLIDIIYDEVLTYFINNSPKKLVQLQQQIDHLYIQDKCINKINRQFTTHTLSLYSHTINEIISILYNTIFGENGKLLDDYVYQLKGQGWCKRVFPPTDNEMYFYIVNCVTTETKKQYKKMIII
jgi:hypothetical protein